MVSPIYLAALLLGAAFLHPLLERVSAALSRLVVLLAVLFAALLPILWIFALAGRGGEALTVHTAGFAAPLSISLRVGVEEALFLILINGAALLGVLYFILQKDEPWQGKAQVLFLTLVLGVNGLVLTRDLFNLFVFLEITSISLYALIGFGRNPDSGEAGFKYMVAGGIASSLFLIGVIYLYRLTGTLSLDILIGEGIAGSGSGLANAGAGVTALFLVLGAILIELKPFPANGWGADVYQAAHPGVSAMISSAAAAALLFVLYKLTPLMGSDLLQVTAVSGGITFAASQLAAMKQRSVRRMLGFSSIGQMGLAVMAAALGPQLAGSSAAAGLLSGFARNLPAWAAPLMEGAFPLLLLLAGSHAFSKAGLFWVSGMLQSVTLPSASETQAVPVGSGKDVGHSSAEASARFPQPRHPLLTGTLGVLAAALAGFPPFPAFWAKWLLILLLTGSGMGFAAVVVLIGSLIEAWYLFRWYLLTVRSQEDTGTVHDEMVPDDFSPETMFEGSVRGSMEDSDRSASASRLLPPADSARLPAVTAVPLLGALVLAAVGALLALTTFAGFGTLSMLGEALRTGLPTGSGGMLGGSGETLLLLPLAAVGLFALLDLLRMPVRGEVIIGMILTAAYALILLPELSGIRLVFGLVFIVGAVVQMIPLLVRRGLHPGLMGLLTAMVFSLGSLLIFRTGLGLFFSWEIMTAASFFLVSRGRKASGAALRYLTFSLAGAFAILGGLARMHFGIDGTLTAVLFAAGFLTKMGALGLHIWLPGSYAESDDDLSPLFSSILGKAGLFMLFISAGLYVPELLPDGAFAGVSLGTLLGWVGALTAFAGAFLALFKEDIKYALAYSSMGQIGYMLLSYALMTQLGWMNSLYLAVTHLLFKAMLFIAAAGVVHRTGTRLMYRMGGLISRMPFSFFTVLIAIIALSGVPPLTGFGSKWMLYTALIDKGWYLQAGIAMFASGIAFLYLFRLIHTMFLGQLKDEHRAVREAPLPYLIPQAAGIIGIMLASMYPGLLLKPLQVAVEPFFSGEIGWEGGTVISRLGYWNGSTVIYVTMGVFLVPLVWLLYVRRRNTRKIGQFNIVYAAERPYRPETTHYAYNFFAPYRKALGFLLRPGVTRFWTAVASVADTAGASIRRIYSGNVQTSSLLILIYVAALLLTLQGGYLG